MSTITTILGTDVIANSRSVINTNFSNLNTDKAETTDVVLKSAYDANTILQATTNDTPVAITIGEQTVIGRATGGNITALAIDSDLTSVSSNDDTLPSAKATKTALDLKAPLASPTFTGNLTTPTIKITSGSPGVGKILTSDADGDATWETFSGGSSTAIDSTQSLYNNFEIVFSGSGATPTGDTWDVGGTMNSATRWNGTMVRPTFGTNTSVTQFLPGTIGASSAFYQFGSTKDVIISFNAKFSSVSGQVGIGIVDNVDCLYDVTQSGGKLMFRYNGTTLHASNGEAGTNTSTDVTSGITVTNWNAYKIVYTYGTDVKFYINNTLVATHTTNRPTSSSNGKFGFGGATSTNTAEIANVVVSIEK